MRRCASILATAAFLVSVAAAEDPASFVLAVWRHGDRSPTECFPSDASKCAERWPDGFGMLTALGMNMGFNLGKTLRQRYVESFNLISGNYTRKSILVRSTDFDRTLQTAQSVMTGLFPPGTGPRQANGSPGLTPSYLQPVPEHTVPQVDDSLLLAYSSATCPAVSAADRAEQAQNNAEWAQASAQWDTVKDAVQAATQLPPSALTVNAMFAAWDVAVCDISHNFSLPTGMQGNASLLTTMQQVADFTLQHLFATLLQQQLTAGLLVADMVNRLQAAQAGAVQPGWDPSSYPKDDQNDTLVRLGPRMYGYSAHDTTLTALLSALGVYNGPHPPYASSVVLEGVARQASPAVRGGAATVWSVRGFYNTGQSVGDGAFGPQQLLSLPCSQRLASSTLRAQGVLPAGECTVDDFAAHYAAVALTTEQWTTACNGAPSPSPSPAVHWAASQIETTAGVGVGSFFAGALLLGTIFWCVRRRSAPAERDTLLEKAGYA
jgi:hypothetical protein